MNVVLARHYRTGELFEFTIEDGRYAKIEPARESFSESFLIAPGLCDVQINGIGGVDFNNPITRDDWKSACRALFAHGCTHFLATLITNLPANYWELISRIESVRTEPNSPFRGYHFEGPFLNPSPGTRGAHRSDWMCPADEQILNVWQDACQGQVRLVTVAPEISPDKSLPFIEGAVSEGIRISLGHSEPSKEILSAAIASGATCWTHLGNAIGETNRKFDNVIFDFLSRDRGFASLIPDGIHVPAHAFKVMAQVLGERLLLTTDAMSGAGARPGRYRVCHHDIELAENGLARTSEGRLAGSTITPFAGVFKATAMSGLPWQDLWDAFSIRPAAWLGISHGLTAGNEASFCLLKTNPSPHLAATFLEGREVFSDGAEFASRG